MSNSGTWKHLSLSRATGVLQTRASEVALNVSQPTFTVQIRQHLKKRSASQVAGSHDVRSLVQLTQSTGRELAPALERSLKDLSSLLASTTALSSQTSGHVSVAALPSLCGSMLPRVIKLLAGKKQSGAFQCSWSIRSGFAFRRW